MPYTGLDTPEARAYRLLQRTITLCTFVVILIMTFVFLFAGHTSQNRCEELQGIRTYILGATDRAISSLPTIDYYKKHPAEKARALENLQNQRDEFATPLNCSIF